mgnify:CR=1 FL=1
MKMYTNESQTVKLVELGLPKPKSEVRSERGPFSSDARKAYSIGELIEMLPENIAKEDEMPSTLNISLLDGEWCVEYADFLGADFSFRSVELIDAIFNMIEKLKEEE